MNEAISNAPAAQAAGVAVVGGGAAGLMAAIFAAREGAPTVLLDGAARLGAKILISGGGRCNVTHERVTPDDFNGSNRNLIAKVLRAFDAAAAVRFFTSLGVELKREETGKLFPVTDRAATVLEALLGEARRAGVEIRTRSRVTEIARRGEGFALETSSGPLFAKTVVLATGGRSVPKSGSDGAGYDLARLFGHSVAPAFPALVPLLLEPGHWLMALAGVACDVELSLLGGRGRLVRRVSGALLMTHFGLSGPAALDMSRHWIAARSEGDALLTACLVPGDDFESVDSWIVDAARESPRRTIANLLRSRLTDRLAEGLLREAAGVEGDTPLGRLARDERRRVAHSLTALPLPVVGDRGFAFAEVTAGGVPLDEVDVRTMESKLCAGLHLCGEILDVDGRIGGFNFQWAWASGRAAGMGAGRGLSSPQS